MRRLKRFFAVFVAMVMILGNLPAYAAGIGTTAKSEYLKTEKRAFSEFKKSFEKSEFGKLISFTNSIDGTYSSEMDIEVKIPDIKTRKYVIKENGTYKERYEDGVIEGYVEGEKVATFNAVANDNYISLQVPELYEKYLTIDMNDLEGLVKKFDEDFDTTSLPKGIYYNSDVKEILTLTKEEEKIVNNALKKYAKLLDDKLLKNSYFERGNKQTITINNVSYKCDMVTYKISAKQFLDGFETIWKEVKKDTEFVDLVWNKFESLYELTSKLNGEYEELPTKEQVLGAIDTLISSLKKEVKDDDGVLESILYHQDGKLIRRDFGVSTEDEEELISIYTVSNNKGAYYALYTDSSKIEDIVSKNSKETIHNIIITTKDTDYDFVDGELIKNEVEEVNKATIKVSKINSTKYNVEFSVDGSDVKGTMEYTNNKATSKEYDISMDFDVIAGSQTFEINLKIAYEKDIKLNKIDAKNNEVNLNEKSKEELTKLFEDNKDEIIEKFKGKFGSAFYFDEIMSATQKTMDRMQSRADIATGAQICKAVRVWFTDFTVDPTFSQGRDIKISSDYWTKYSELPDIDQYISSDMMTSDKYDYYVALTAPRNSVSAKIVVGVSETGTDLPVPTSVIEASYETDGARVVYVEP